MEPRRVSAAALLMDELDAKGADSEPSATRVAPHKSEGLEEGHRERHVEGESSIRENQQIARSKGKDKGKGQLRP